MTANNSSNGGVEWLDFTAGAAFTFLFAYLSELLFDTAMIGIPVAMILIWIGMKTEPRWGRVQEE